MNKTYDDFDTQIQFEELYDDQMLSMITFLWLSEQSLKVKVWNN